MRGQTRVRGPTGTPPISLALNRRASIGAIAGFAFAFTCTAGGLGPLVGGHIRDRTGAYDAAFWLGAALNGVALVIAILLRRAAARLPRPGG